MSPGSGSNGGSGAETGSSAANARPRPRPAPELPPDAHKGDAGRLLFLCGQVTMPGAAILSMRAALRAGAGLVTLACFDAELLGVVPAAVPEAIYLDLSRTDDLKSGRLPAELLGRADHALIAGPGLGRSERTVELVRCLVSGSGRAGTFRGPLVLDADALNVLGERPELLTDYPGPLVLTPHPGEASRLLGRAVPSDPEGRQECARELARRAGALCCLKGEGTVVTDGVRSYVNLTGNPGMATAGAGDVLSGILGAYLASCVTLGDLGPRRVAWSPFDAALAAVHVHGLAGDMAAATLGRRGLIASDLVEYLPAAQRRFAEHG